MFRQMRRKNQALSAEECEKILREGTSGVIALDGDDGYPYAVPISYVFCDHKIYFHCAKSGHKLDAIARNEKASFCVIGEDHVIPEEYTTQYKSVIVFGKIRILEDNGEKRAAIEQLALKYAPDDTRENRQKEIEQYQSALCMLEMSIAHMSGKKRKEP